jgi:NitT/TauT family transport system permease protein
MTENRGTINEVIAEEKVVKKRKSFRDWFMKYYVFVLVPAVFVAVVGGLQFYLVAARVPTYVFPKPSQIAVAFVQEFSRTILPHLWITFQEVILGYLIGAVVGIVLGALVEHSRIVEAVITPYMLVLVTTPMVALVPLLMLRFGFSIITRIIACALGSGPVIMMNTVGGLRRTSQVRLELMKTLRASAWQTFIKVKFPSALPAISTGLVVGIIFSIITAVGAEFVGGAVGLGNRIMYFSQLIQTPKIYAIILTLSIMGITLYLLVYNFTAKITRWRE